MDHDDGVEEGVGESCWPAAAGLVSSGGGGAHDIRKEIHDRLLEIGNEEALGDPCFRHTLDQHFERLPARSASPNTSTYLGAARRSVTWPSHHRLVLLGIVQLFHRFAGRQGGGRAAAPAHPRRVRRPRPPPGLPRPLHTVHSGGQAAAGRREIFPDTKR